MRWFLAVCCALAILTASSTAWAAEDRFGVEVKAGTLGLGGDFAAQVIPMLGLRATLNQYDFSEGFDKSGIHYDGTLKVGGYGALADFYPTKGKFHLTAGLLSNRNKVDLVTKPDADLTIGDNTYTPQQVGTLTGEMKFRSTVPYFGLGYGNPARGPHRVGFVFDIGVEPQGSPKASLTSSAGQVLQSDLDKEAAKIEDDTKNFKLWPVLALGISIRL